MSAMSLVTAAGVVGFCVIGGPTALASANASKAAIKVVSLSTTSGPDSYETWVDGAKAYFDQVNRDGGVNGHKVDFKIEDDNGNPTQDTELATKAVDSGTVALVGSVSSSECAANGPYYDKVGMIDIDIGNSPECFDNPDIAPVNAGPQIDPENGMLYAAKVLHKKKVCFFSLAFPGEAPLAAAAVTGFEKLSGQKVTKWVGDYPVTANPQPAIEEFKNAGCQAVMLNMKDIQGAPVIKDAAADGIHGITWISGLAMATPQLLSDLGPLADGSYYGYEFGPFDIPSAAAMVKAFRADKVPLSQPEEASYTAAWIFGHVLATIKGSITRASVLKAFRDTKPFSVPTMGTLFSFGTAKKHHPNLGSFWVKVVKDKFVNTKGADSWFSLDPSALKTS